MDPKDREPIAEESKFEELLKKDRYTVHEIAELFRLGEDVIRHAVFSGELQAERAGHDILYVERHDLVEWLKRLRYQ